MKAMLLAAGEGTRFRPHTLRWPKPAIPLLNVPLGFYSFDYLKAAGVKSLVVNTFHLPEKIKSLYQSQSHFPIQFSDEVGQILGSGGGLGHARSHFTQEDDFFLLNADEVLLSSDNRIFTKLMIQHKERNAFSTLLVTNHPEVGRKFGGIWVDKTGAVIGFGKARPEMAVHGYHFLGVQALNKKVFSYIPADVESNILYDVLANAIADKQKIAILSINVHWFETGNLNDYLLGTRWLLQQLAQKDPALNGLKQFLTVMTPESQLILNPEGQFWVHQQSEVYQSSMSHFAVIGKGSRIMDSSLDSSVVGENQMVRASTSSHELIL